MRTESQQRAMEKQMQKRKGQHQCNLSRVKPEFTALLAEMRPGYTSNEACLYAALLELKNKDVWKHPYSIGDFGNGS